VTLLRDIPLNGGWSGLPATGEVLQTDDGLFTVTEKPTGVPGYLEFVTDPLGERGTVLKSSVDSFTFPTTGNPTGTNGNRSEFYHQPETVSAGNPVERWYQFGIMFDEDWGGAQGDRYIVMQVHDTPDGGDNARWPNFVLMADHLNLMAMIPTTNPPTEDNTFRLGGSAKFELNKWIDVVLHVKWSMEPDGFMELFINRYPIMKEYSVGTAYDDVNGPYFKLGIYNTYKHTGKTSAAHYSAVKHYSGVEPYGDIVGTLRTISVNI
jgi:hypothetical protein